MCYLIKNHTIVIQRVILMLHFRPSALQRLLHTFYPVTCPTRIKSLIIGPISPLGRPRRSLEDNIKMDLQEVGGGCGDWMELAQDRDRWGHGEEHSGSKNAGNFLTSCRTSSFSRRTLLHGVSKYWAHFILQA